MNPISLLLAFTTRLRRRSLPRRYVSIKGAAVLISFYGETP